MKPIKNLFGKTLVFLSANLSAGALAYGIGERDIIPALMTAGNIFFGIAIIAFFFLLHVFFSKPDEEAK